MRARALRAEFRCIVAAVGHWPQVDVFKTEAFAQDSPPLVGSNPHFQLYGFDFVVSETGGRGSGTPEQSNVWLMEVNRSP
jgi:hypothetical protein